MPNFQHRVHIPFLKVQGFTNDLVHWQVFGHKVCKFSPTTDHQHAYKIAILAGQTLLFYSYPDCTLFTPQPFGVFQSAHPKKESSKFKISLTLSFSS